MTIRIRIANLDTRDTAVVSVETRSVSKEGIETRSKPDELKGGEAIEKYVYEGQQLLVTEVRNG